MRSGGSGESFRSGATVIPKPSPARIWVAVPTSCPTTDGTGTLLPLTTAWSMGGNCQRGWPSSVGVSASFQMCAENEPKISPGWFSYPGTSDSGALDDFGSNVATDAVMFGVKPMNQAELFRPVSPALAVPVLPAMSLPPAP